MIAVYAVSVFPKALKRMFYSSVAFVLPGQTRFDRTLD